MYWGENWDTNYDNDVIVNNLLDYDSDGDGFADGIELPLGFDPSNGDEHPQSIPTLDRLSMILLSMLLILIGGGLIVRHNKKIN